MNFIEACKQFKPFKIKGARSPESYFVKPTDNKLYHSNCLDLSMSEEVTSDKIIYLMKFNDFEIVGGINKELKTLKDIEIRHRLYEIGKCPNCSPNSIGYCSSDKLRQEAIKWIKSNSPYLNDCDDAVGIWIQHFFNLTDEDLKEE